MASCSHHELTRLSQWIDPRMRIVQLASIVRNVPLANGSFSHTLSFAGDCAVSNRAAFTVETTETERAVTNRSIADVDQTHEQTREALALNKDARHARERSAHAQGNARRTLKRLMTAPTNGEAAMSASATIKQHQRATARRVAAICPRCCRSCQVARNRSR